MLGFVGVGYQGICSLWHYEDESIILWRSEVHEDSSQNIHPCQTTACTSLTQVSLGVVAQDQNQVQKTHVKNGNKFGACLSLLPMWQPTRTSHNKVSLYSPSKTPSNAFFHHFQSLIVKYSSSLSSHFAFSSSFPFEMFLLGSEIKVGREDGPVLHRLWQPTAVETWPKRHWVNHCLCQLIFAGKDILCPSTPSQMWKSYPTSYKHETKHLRHFHGFPRLPHEIQRLTPPLHSLPWFLYCHFLHSAIHCSL